MSNTKLKPCPFCGAEASQPERIKYIGRPSWKIGCVIFCVHMYRGTKKEAIESWNRRIES